MIVQFRFPEGEISANVSSDLLQDLDTLLQRGVVTTDLAFRFLQQVEFFDSLASDLRKEYEGQVIAIAGQKVIATSSSLPEALNWFQENREATPVYIVDLGRQATVGQDVQSFALLGT